MQKSSPPLHNRRLVKRVGTGTTTAGTRSREEKPPKDALPAARLSALVSSWLMAGDINQHSERTTESRRDRLDGLLWLSARQGWQKFGRDEAREFLHYLTTGHAETGGRFGKPRLKTPLSSGSVKSYFSSLRTFCRWCVREGYCDISPCDRMDAPVDRPDQVQPFTDAEVRALLAGSKRKRGNNRGGAVSLGVLAKIRDEALLLILLDTGIRASELCGLDVGDVDIVTRQLRVREAKGGKARTVPFGPRTRRALFDFMNFAGLTEQPQDTPLFGSARGTNVGGRLTRRGLGLILARTCAAAGITRAHTGPHTLRHSFAVSYLKNGGDVFSLQTIMGHTSPSVTRRYVALAQADITAKHAAASPVERLLGDGRNRR